MAMRHVLNSAGTNTIVTNATGCSEVTTSQYPRSAFKTPWIHANFENAVPVASGILAALEQKKKNKGVNIIAFGGDGATFDIGMGHLSGMWARGENILYVCFDNEAYMNTGEQASGSTAKNAGTTTTPAGKESLGNDKNKKNMPQIALAHNCAYVATATVGNIIDIQNKVKKALTVPGPKYLQILCSCVPGWKIESQNSVKVAKLAQQTALYPVLEYIDGKLTKVDKCPKPRPKVTEYLKLQGRFKHLFKSAEGKRGIQELQQIADMNAAKYGL